MKKIYLENLVANFTFLFSNFEHISAYKRVNASFYKAYLFAIIFCLHGTLSFSQIYISSNKFSYQAGELATLSINGLDQPLKSPNTCLKVNDLSSALVDSVGNEILPDSTQLLSVDGNYSLRIYK